VTDTTVDRARVLEELDAKLRAQVDERVARGFCGCGCETPLPANPGRRKYRNERHKQRAYRKRLELEAKALGMSSRLSLKALDAATTTRERHADAEPPRKRPQRRRSRPRPGVTIYLPTLDVAERLELVLSAMRCEPRPDGSSLDVLLYTLRPALERRRRRDA
jgi:hypothetical protein